MLDFFREVERVQRDPMVANIVRRVKPQHRLKAIWPLASKKRICEPDQLDEDGNGDATNEMLYQQEQGGPSLIRGHGGCGHEQPAWRKEGLKLISVGKATNSEKEEVSWEIYSSHLANAFSRRPMNHKRSLFRRATFTISFKRFRLKTYTSWV